MPSVYVPPVSMPSTNALWESLLVLNFLSVYLQVESSAADGFHFEWV
jgi:hypothetical protein